MKKHNEREERLAEMLISNGITEYEIMDKVLVSEDGNIVVRCSVKYTIAENCSCVEDYYLNLE